MLRGIASVEGRLAAGVRRVRVARNAWTCGGCRCAFRAVEVQVRARNPT